MTTEFDFERKTVLLNSGYEMAIPTDWTRFRQLYGEWRANTSQAGTLCGKFAWKICTSANTFTAVSESMKPLTALPSRLLLDYLL